MAIRDCTCEKDIQRDVPPENIIVPSDILKVDPNCPVHGKSADQEKMQ